MIAGPPTGRSRMLYAGVFAVAGTGVTADLWADRGPLLAVVAFLAFATIAAGVVAPRFRAWLRERPHLDAFLMFPAGLALVAFLTDLPLATCMLLAALLWLGLSLTVTWRRQREQVERETGGEAGGQPPHG